MHPRWAGVLVYTASGRPCVSQSARFLGASNFGNLDFISLVWFSSRSVLYIDSNAFFALLHGQVESPRGDKFYLSRALTTLGLALSLQVYHSQPPVYKKRGLLTSVLKYKQAGFAPRAKENLLAWRHSNSSVARFTCTYFRHCKQVKYFFLNLLHLNTLYFDGLHL